jgi:hypothetical protein
MEKVVAVDFGKEQRESARRLARLLDLVVGRDEEMLANPKKYWDRAVDEIIRLRTQIETAREALRQPLSFELEAQNHCPVLDTLTVPRDRWEALKRAEAVILGDSN